MVRRGWTRPVPLLAGIQGLARTMLILILAVLVRVSPVVPIDIVLLDEALLQSGRLFIAAGRESETVPVPV
jgi:hypothetical protein